MTTDFRPMVGGVADHLHRLADAMAATIPVTVLTSAPQNGSKWPHAYQLEALPPVPVRRVSESFGDGFAPTRKIRTGAYFLNLRVYGGRTISHLTDRWHGDAVVLIGIWDMAAHAWCAACRRAGVPYYLFTHGAEITQSLHGPVPRWREVDFREAAGVIACSAATARLAAERLQLSAPPLVVHPSVGPRPPASETARQSQELRERFGLAEGRTMLSVGRLVPRKGFDLALRAMATLALDLPDLSYVLAGTGPERERLESLARELGVGPRVHFLGAVDDLTKWAAYDACDLFLMPNRILGGTDFEGFGIVFLEAALAGRPSIAGRTGGAADAVVHDATGLLIDPESPDELPAALRRLLEDAALRTRLGRTGAARAHEQFTPAAAADSLRAQCGWN